MVPVGLSGAAAVLCSSDLTFLRAGDPHNDKTPDTSGARAWAGHTIESQSLDSIKYMCKRRLHLSAALL